MQNFVELRTYGPGLRVSPFCQELIHGCLGLVGLVLPFLSRSVLGSGHFVTDGATKIPVIQGQRTPAALASRAAEVP